MATTLTHSDSLLPANHAYSFGVILFNLIPIMLSAILVCENSLIWLRRHSDLFLVSLLLGAFVEFSGLRFRLSHTMWLKFVQGIQ